ncbi:MAG TPA: endonuclease/exonuclease/phosphatase family protein [Candidatus Paceibacterota bacterium]|nr:endonuclease/exonuclease/phosphatase family protein [Candidatus Paceibacterota bacterium]HSA00159.1 endonuclease/exonuclease/phosphatase family protein [Candidatus Paceibacterota bacterium]
MHTTKISAQSSSEQATLSIECPSPVPSPHKPDRKKAIAVLTANGLSLLIVLLFCGACATQEPDSSPLALRVLTYNIHHGEGTDGRLDLERIAALMLEHRPDLVALQEVDRGTTRTQKRDLAAELGRLTGMETLFSKNIDFQGGEYGNAILSRHRILSSTNLHYRMLRPGEQRGLLQATIQCAGREIVFMATHLDYRPDPAERLSNVEEIKAAAQKSGKPVILAGDFNDHPDRDVHRAMKTMFLDAWEQGGSGDGFTYSSASPKSRIDYVYCYPPGRWQVTRAEVLQSPASDHLPVLFHLSLRE